VLLLPGDDNPKYKDDSRVTAFQGKVDFDMQIITNADLLELESRIKSKARELDLLLGYSKGRWTAIDDNVPLVRVGFPTFDCAGLYRHPVVGHAGAIWLAEHPVHRYGIPAEQRVDSRRLVIVAEVRA